MKNKKEDNDEQFLTMIKKLGDTIGPLFLKNQEINAPIIKRQQ